MKFAPDPLDVVRDGETVGRVIRVDHLPAQDLLIIRAADDTEILVPFVKAIVPEVDIAAGRVVVTPPPGLFEELPGQDDEPEASASDEPSSDEESGTGDAGRAED